MKREVRLFFILLMIVGVLSFLFGVSASIDSQVEDVANTADKSIQGVDRFLSSSEVRSEYLKQEWLKITQSQPFGKYILPVHNYLILHKQVFGYLLGINYQFSWKFFLAFIFWVVLVVFCFRIIRGVFVFLMLKIPSVASKNYKQKIRNFSKSSVTTFFINIGLFLVILLLVSAIRIPLGLATVVYGLFASDTTTIMRVIYFCVIFGGIFLLDMLYKKMSRFAGIYKKARAQIMTNKEIERLSKELEGIESGKKNIVSQVQSPQPQGKLVSEEDREEEERDAALAQAREDLEGVADED